MPPVNGSRQRPTIEHAENIAGARHTIAHVHTGVVPAGPPRYRYRDAAYSSRKHSTAKGMVPTRNGASLAIERASVQRCACME